MKAFIFDHKYWATAHVKAETEAEARQKLSEWSELHNLLVTEDVEITMATSEGDPDLVEVEEYA